MTMGCFLTFEAAMAKLDLKDYPKIYPFVPMTVEEIYKDVKNVTEDDDFIKKFSDMVSSDMTNARTETKPWSGSYWPLSKGTIANSYADSEIGYYADAGWVIWKSNYKSFKKRLKKELANVDQMSEEDLAKLAPSEKYDLLLGDKSFDLTRRLWEYMNDWGENKRNAFLVEYKGEKVTENVRLVDENALALAEKYVSWGWYKDADEAFEKDYELQGGLSVENALVLVKMGKYSNVTEAFPEAVDMAIEQSKDYVKTKTSNFMAAWEGICNGWSTAAGTVPRPRKAVSFKLPNGKNLKFYPSDIRGLASLYWVNSFIQNNLVKDEQGNYMRGGTVSAGLRCNTDVKTDSYGRLYDSEKDPFSKQRDVRCAGVHPAKWHMGLVNIIGKQGRSFVVERKVGAPVDNHPMYGYEMKFFNPKTGEDVSSAMEAVVDIDKNDQFQNLRHKDAVKIVGVETTMKYLNYLIPSRHNKSSEDRDENVDKTMLYDLELNAEGEIVGGQWRAVKVGTPKYETRPGTRLRRREKLNHNQPDFFWSVTKDWKETGLFDNNSGLTVWSDKTKTPPTTWKETAKEVHAFMYQEKYSYMTGQKCDMVNTKTGKLRSVSCEKEINKPQPLSNVLNTLVELAK